MAHLLRVPEIAAGATEAVLATWPVPENSPYSATDVIATVETAKAVIDIEAEENGVILRRLVPEGADVAVGQPIALIGAPGESADNIEDELRAQGITPGVPTAAAGLAPAEAGLPAASVNGAPERTFISPIARRLARAADLDPRDISGTGPNGRIMRRDVERAARTAATRQSQRTIARSRTAGSGRRSPAGSPRASRPSRTSTSAAAPGPASCCGCARNSTKAPAVSGFR